jgi:hypothetical protein
MSLDAKPIMFHQYNPFLVEVMRERLYQLLDPEMQAMIPAIVQESENGFSELPPKLRQKWPILLKGLIQHQPLYSTTDRQT